MGFILGALKILVFALCIGALLGLALSIVIFVPLTIYSIPYILWVGNQNTRGKYKELCQKDEGVFKCAKRATKLYKAWITHKEPTF